MNPRLVITGMGAITPIGLNVDDYWRALVDGVCGVGEITRFDASRLPVRIAAEVKGYDPAMLLPPGVARGSEKFMRFAFSAAEEALSQAGICVSQYPARVAICMGTALAGVNAIAESGVDYAASHTGKISPHLVPRVLSNMAVSHFSIVHGLRGPSFTLGTACSSGGDAVMSAAMLILSGEADAVIVMGGESILNPGIVSSLAQAKALSRRNGSPGTASRPFDLERDGFVIGEGGGALVIEREDFALARGAHIYALLSGWANTLDGYHITAPDPNGAGAAACMRAALKRANLPPSAINYVNAHGTATHLGDMAETRALKAVFGSIESAPPTSSTKGATGHLMGAGGLTEIIACVKAIETGIIPPTLNLNNSDPECDLDFVPNVARETRVDAAMSNSLGFGGQNSSIIVRRYHPRELPYARNL